MWVSESITICYLCTLTANVDVGSNIAR